MASLWGKEPSVRKREREREKCLKLDEDIPDAGLINCVDLLLFMRRITAQTFEEVVAARVAMIVCNSQSSLASKNVNAVNHIRRPALEPIGWKGTYLTFFKWTYQSGDWEWFEIVALSLAEPYHCPWGGNTHAECMCGYVTAPADEQCRTDVWADCIDATGSSPKCVWSFTVVLIHWFISYNARLRLRHEFSACKENLTQLQLSSPNSCSKKSSCIGRLQSAISWKTRAKHAATEWRPTLKDWAEAPAEQCRWIFLPSMQWILDLYSELCCAIIH